MKSKSIAGALVFGMILSGGCALWTSREDGETLKTDVQHMKDRLAQVEGETEEERRRLSEMIERAQSEVESLEETLTKATRVLARNSADFGAEMEGLKADMRKTEGALAEIRHEVEVLGLKVDASDQKVKEFAAAAGLDMPVDESKIPSQKSAHFDAIKASVDEGRHGEARSLANVYLDRYPKDANADDVQLLIAKSYLEQKRWAKSLGALRRFTDKYPKSDLTPEVLYEMARAFYNLGDCTDANILVDAVTSRHASSPFAKKARELKAQMKKNKSRCTS